MQTADSLRNNVHKKYLNVRNLNNIVQSDRFDDAYSIATEAQKYLFEHYILQSNQTALVILINDILNPSRELSVRALRRVAQRLGIQNYNNLPKASLLSEITQYENAITNNDRNRTTLIESESGSKEYK